MKPWHDCPACPACKARVAITEVPSTGEPLPPPQLACPACGHEWTATPEERAQAEAADAAWESEQCGWRP